MVAIVAGSVAGTVVVTVVASVVATVVVIVAATVAETGVESVVASVVGTAGDVAASAVVCFSHVCTAYVRLTDSSIQATAALAPAPAASATRRTRKPTLVLQNTQPQAHASFLEFLCPPAVLYSH